MRARPEAVEAVPHVWVTDGAYPSKVPTTFPSIDTRALPIDGPDTVNRLTPPPENGREIVAPPRRSHRYEPPIAPGRATLPQPKDVPAPSCSMLTVEVNVATTLIGPDTGIEQMGSSPVQPPLQPVNADAESGAAVRSIVLPAANVAAHIVPHVIPVGRT